MLNTTLRPLFCFAGCLFFTVAAHAGTISYSVVNLGDLGGNGSTYASGINASGQVTGASDSKAFLYSNGAITALGEFNAVGNAINASGAVAGYQQPVQFPVAAVFSGGSVTSIGTLNGADSLGYAINASGQVAGTYEIYVGSGNVHYRSAAFVYSNSIATALPTLGGTSVFDGSSAAGINDSGQITGASSTTNHLTHAYLYSSGTITDLGTLGGNSSAGAAINASGQIVGDSTTAAGSDDPFLYTGGSLTDLGLLSGATGGAASALNNNGQIVGSDYTNGSDIPFLYSGGVLYNLNTLVDPSLNLNLTDAAGINDAGQIIVNDQDNGFAYLLTPDTAAPEPSSLLLGASGIALMLLAARRRLHVSPR